jgi:hypothetical protein
LCIRGFPCGLLRVFVQVLRFWFCGFVGSARVNKILLTYKKIIIIIIIVNSSQYFKFCLLFLLIPSC